MFFGIFPQSEENSKILPKEVFQRRLEGIHERLIPLLDNFDNIGLSGYNELRKITEDVTQQIIELNKLLVQSSVLKLRREQVKDCEQLIKNYEETKQVLKGLLIQSSKSLEKKWMVIVLIIVLVFLPLFVVWTK